MKFRLITALGALSGALFFAQVLLRHIYSYDIKDGTIRMLLFSVVPMFTIGVNDVVDVRNCTPKELSDGPFLALRLGNRIWGKSVLIRRRHGFAKAIVITPDDPEEFVEQVTRLKRV